MKVLFALSILCALTALLMACRDTAEPITYVNETEETLWDYVQSNHLSQLMGDDVLRPHSSLNTSVFLGGGSLSWVRVAATRQDGQWVFDRTYSEDEWKRAGGRVVFSSLTPIDPPLNVNVYPRDDAPRPFLPSGRLPSSQLTPIR